MWLSVLRRLSSILSTIAVPLPPSLREVPRRGGGSVLRQWGIADHTNDTPSVAARQLPQRGSRGHGFAQPRLSCWMPPAGQSRRPAPTDWTHCIPLTGALSVHWRKRHIADKTNMHIYQFVSALYGRMFSCQKQKKVDNPPSPFYTIHQYREKHGGLTDNGQKMGCCHPQTVRRYAPKGLYLSSGFL